MDPKATKRVGSILEVLEACSKFDFSELEEEIAALLRPEPPVDRNEVQIVGDINKKVDKKFTKHEVSSFVRPKQRDYIPGLSTKLDDDEDSKTDKDNSIPFLSSSTSPTTSTSPSSRKPFNSPDIRYRDQAGSRNRQSSPHWKIDDKPCHSSAHFNPGGRSQQSNVHGESHSRPGHHRESPSSSRRSPGESQSNRSPQSSGQFYHRKPDWQLKKESPETSPHQSSSLSPSQSNPSQLSQKEKEDELAQWTVPTDHRNRRPGNYHSNNYRGGSNYRGGPRGRGGRGRGGRGRKLTPEESEAIRQKVLARDAEAEREIMAACGITSFD